MGTSSHNQLGPPVEKLKGCQRHVELVVEKRHLKHPRNAPQLVLRPVPVTIFLAHEVRLGPSRGSHSVTVHALKKAQQAPGFRRPSPNRRNARP